MLSAIINIFVTNLIIGIVCLSSGKLLLYKFNIQQSFAIYLISGIILLSQLSLLLNFFTPINKIIGFIIIFFFSSYFFFHKNYKKDLFRLITISLFSIFFYYAGNNAEDYSIYHLINLNAIISNKIVLGLTHIKFNLGQSPITFYGDAIFQNLPFIKYKYNYLSFFAFAAILIFSYDLFKKKEIFKFCDYFLLVSTIYLTLKFSRLGAHGADFIHVALVTIGLFFFFKINFKDIGNLFNKQLIIVSTLFLSNAYFFKIFSIFYYLLLLIILFFLIREKCIKNYYKIIIFVIVINIIFLLKNFLISGCLIFPISETCFDKISWGMGKLSIDNWKLINEAWTKGWYNYFNIDYKEYIKDFGWLTIWLNNHFIKSLEKLFVPIIFIIILIKILIKNNRYENNFNLNILFVFFVALFSSLIWFLNSPMTRLGLSNLLPFIIILINRNLFKDINFEINRKYLNIIIILIPAFFLVKNIIRIIKIEKNYENYPYPRINKDDANIANTNKIKKLNENNVNYYVYDGKKCLIVKFPCLIKNENKNYFFYKNKNYLILKKKINESK